jgi:hypothetical protein
MDRRFMQVREDLDHLEDLVRTPRLTSPRIKLVAPCLRRLLIDEGGILQRVAATLDVNLILNTFDLSKRESHANAGHVVFYETGVDGPKWPVHVLLERHLPNGSKIELDDPPKRISLQLPEWLSQNILYFCGAFISRLEVLQYVANKQGGVHLDSTPSASLPSEKLNTIERVRASTRITQGDDLVYNCNMDLRYFLHDKALPQFDSRVGIDFVLLEFAAAYILIIQSDSVIRIRSLLAEHD